MKAPKLVGVYPYSDQRPTFGLPIFRYGSEWLIQRPKFQNEAKFTFDIIDAEDVQSKLIPTWTNPDPKELIVAYVSVGDQVEIGSKSQVREKLSYLAKGGAGAGIALQAAEILGLDEDRRAALATVARSIKIKAGGRAAASFAKSAALSAAWDHVQRTNLSEDDKKSVLAQLHMITINIDGATPTVDLSEIEERLRKFIDVNEIARLIHAEVLDPLLQAADNDKSAEFDIYNELPRAQQTLDAMIGLDKRMTSSSYYRLINLAGALGVHGLDEIVELIKGYNHAEISDIATGARQGQTSRVELMMMAAMGDEYIKRYPYDGSEYLRRYHMTMLDRLREAGVSVGTKRPRHPANRKFGTVRARKQTSPSIPSLFDFDKPTPMPE